MVRHLESHTFNPISMTDHLITLLIPTFNLNFLLSHTLPNSLTSLHNFSSESAPRAASSVNHSWFISNRLPFTLNNSSPSSSTTPSIYILSNHGDLTQLCWNTTLTRNSSLTSIPPLIHIWNNVKKMCLKLWKQLPTSLTGDVNE